MHLNDDEKWMNEWMNFTLLYIKINIQLKLKVLILIKVYIIYLLYLSLLFPLFFFFSFFSHCVIFCAVFSILMKYRLIVLLYFDVFLNLFSWNLFIIPSIYDVNYCCPSSFCEFILVSCLIMLSIVRCCPWHLHVFNYWYNSNL